MRRLAKVPNECGAYAPLKANSVVRQTKILRLEAVNTTKPPGTSVGAKKASEGLDDRLRGRYRATVSRCGHRPATLTTS